MKRATLASQGRFRLLRRVPAHPARQHGAGCSNCGTGWHHLRPGSLDRRGKLSHESAVSGRGRLGPDAPMPPAPRGPAIGGCRNSGIFLIAFGCSSVPT